LVHARKRGMSVSIAGKIILVTGGTSGIGEGCTRYFSEIGASVISASNQRERGQALEAELRAEGRDVTFIYAELTNEQSVRQLVEEAVACYGRVDGLHYNAGVWRGGRVNDFTEADWDFVMGVNVKGAFTTLKYVVPVMEQQGQGVVVITTSVAAFVGFPEHALYCASKGALDALIRALATDHAGAIRVVGVCPGTIDTPMLAASSSGWEQSLEELYADVRTRIPVRRLGQPLDVARAAAFLLSDEAGYINGTSLVLDGGTMALPPW
jgi:NAD(P)-dependent dehydrogenase (short-subunit alcohol dehydrogenase family)